MPSQVRQSDLQVICVLCLLAIVSSAGVAQSSDDAALYAARRADQTKRSTNARSTPLTAEEHMHRAGIYMFNRAFAEARGHWQSLIDSYPNDPNVPAALMGIARSYFQERRYEEALRSYEKLAHDYPQTKEGREGLNFSASSLLRMGRSLDAAERYREYIDKYPEGERLETAYLNVIDSYREAGHIEDAITWVNRTRERFARTATDTNALFARLRLDVAESNWKRALESADELLRKQFQNGVNTTPDEVNYLKAYCLDRAGRTQEAIQVYQTIPANFDSYYGGLATEKLSSISDPAARQQVPAREQRARQQIAAATAEFPTPYRWQILHEAKSRSLDPRLVLAVMRQESRFRPRAKSPSAARGLLQLTIDTAEKYAKRAGENHLTEELLYQPGASISIGSEYLAQLARILGNLPDAVVAAYNGGEDNVARWLVRSKQNDNGVFTADIGFAETKGYVFKVIANYRAYQQLYTAELNRR